MATKGDAPVMPQAAAAALSGRRTSRPDGGARERTVKNLKRKGRRPSPRSSSAPGATDHRYGPGKSTSLTAVPLRKELPS
ncbi:hypothetical protein GCM10020227_54090 [Streptomyces flavovirens]